MKQILPFGEKTVMYAKPVLEVSMTDLDHADDGGIGSIDVLFPVKYDSRLIQAMLKEYVSNQLRDIKSMQAQTDEHMGKQYQKFLEEAARVLTKEEIAFQLPANDYLAQGLWEHVWEGGRGMFVCRLRSVLVLETLRQNNAE